MLCSNKIALVCPILIAALAACGIKPVTLVEHSPTEECVLVDAENGFDKSVSIAITAQHAASPLLDPHEKYVRFTHKQLFETLISIDCVGQIRPGLAESWESNDQGTLWTFHLRENARFWDGEDVTAPRIVPHWIETIDTRTEIDSIIAGDDRTVLIHLDTPSLTVPSVLDSPLFAAKKSGADQSQSIGTGQYLSESRDPEELAGVLESHPFSENPGPDIEIFDAQSKDERDLFSENVDLFMTSDPDVIDYANSLDSYQSVVLPWETTYVLLSTTRVIESDNIEANDPLPRELTHRLATEAVRTSSRGFESPLWWNSLQGCPSSEDRIPRRPRATFYISGFRQILFNENDDIARSLAERIVALSAEDADWNPDSAALLSNTGLTGGWGRLDRESILSENPGAKSGGWRRLCIHHTPPSRPIRRLSRLV